MRKAIRRPPLKESPALLTSLQRLQASLAIPTISDRLNEAATQEAFAQHRTLLTTAYPQTFQTLKTHDVGPYSILLEEWPGQNQDLKGSLLMAHQDVVPVDDSDTWQHPPFSGVEADGFIWGRGSQDNKSGVIAILEAVERLVKEGFQPTRTLYCFRSRRRNRWSKWCRQDCGLLGGQEYQARDRT